MDVDIYRLFDSNTILTELSVDGINLSKMIKFNDLGKWKIIKDIFSGSFGNLYSNDRIHVASGNSFDSFVSHCILASNDPNFAKFTQAMIVPQVVS